MKEDPHKDIKQTGNLEHDDDEEGEEDELDAEAQAQMIND